MISSKTHLARSEYEELAPYLKQIRKFTPLTREEEHVLAVRARRGDVRAKHQLVRHNLAFVITIACKLYRGNVRLDDLIQEGNIGLMHAVDKFDPHAGTRFLTYAVWWIRAYTGKYLRGARSAVRTRSGTRAQTDLSLDGMAVHERTASATEWLVDESAGPEEAYLAADGDRAVRCALAKVRQRLGGLAWDIVHNRLERDCPEPLQEIGRHWSVSREWARQVEIETKRFLRRYLRSFDSGTVRKAA